MSDTPIPLSELERDLPAPVGGWAAELGRRGLVVVEDDLGRAAVPRDVARALFAEAREAEARAARRREETEQRVVAADEARRAALPPGIPAGAVPTGMTAAELMMASDPFPATRRQSVLEHALEHPGGAIVIHPLDEGAS
jgi:hypothetical protein